MININSEMFSFKHTLGRTLKSRRIYKQLSYIRTFMPKTEILEKSATLNTGLLFHHSLSSEEV